jgi:peptidoglycan hydrolase-like protein with peptidoglycan-binding domain
MVNQILNGNAPSAPAKPAPSKTGSKPPLSGWLRVGSTGSSVKYVQAALGITQDGIFGKITERRVREFQRAQGLVVDGIVGPITYGRL